MLGLGELPKEYNIKIHGPYDPSVYYGKKDTPFGEVKISELPGWFARRSFNPIDWGRACSRAYWRWCHKYYAPKYCGITPIVQIMVGSMAVFYIINIQKIRSHKNRKYHW